MKFLIGGKVREPKDASKSIQGRLGVIPRPAVFDWRLLIISLNGRRCKNCAPCVVFLQKIKQNCFIFSFPSPDGWRIFYCQENHQQCWWYQKALALHSLFIRAERGTKRSLPLCLEGKVSTELTDEV